MKRLTKYVFVFTQNLAQDFILHATTFEDGSQGGQALTSLSATKHKTIIPRNLCLVIAINKSNCLLHSSSNPDFEKVEKAATGLRFDSL